MNDILEKINDLKYYNSNLPKNMLLSKSDRSSFNRVLFTLLASLELRISNKQIVTLNALDTELVLAPMAKADYIYDYCSRFFRSSRLRRFSVSPTPQNSIKSIARNYFPSEVSFDVGSTSQPGAYESSLM